MIEIKSNFLAEYQTFVERYRDIVYIAKISGNHL